MSRCAINDSFRFSTTTSSLILKPRLTLLSPRNIAKTNIIPQSRKFFDSISMSSQKGVQSVLFNVECQKRFSIWQHNCVQKFKILLFCFVSIFWTHIMRIKQCRKLHWISFRGFLAQDHSFHWNGSCSTTHLIWQRRPFHKLFKYSDQYLFALCLELNLESFISINETQSTWCCSG